MTNPTSQTECSPQRLLLPELISSKTVTVDFQGGDISSDGGVLLLSRMDRSYGYSQRFAACFTDHREPERTEHSPLELIRQRGYGLALGYEDLNDHDLLRTDPLLAAACGKEDPSGQDRQREQDRGKALAGKSTLNRLELTAQGASPACRYKKIEADTEAIEDYFINEFVRSLPRGKEEVILDLDWTDDILYGDQQGRYYNRYYGDYCYTPFYIFCEKWPVVAALQTSDSHHHDQILQLVEKVVARLRQRFPGIRILLRGDSAYGRDWLMRWCENTGVFYVFGLQKNQALDRQLAENLEKAKARFEGTQRGRPWLYKAFKYRARSWPQQQRRVIGKAEWTSRGANPRYIVTNLKAREHPSVRLYEKLYCGRGEMENRIKEQQLDLFADRTSTTALRSNQLRLWFSTFAYLLLNQLRTIGLKGTQWAQATCGTIRSRLMKVGAVVRVTVRRVWVHLSSAFPLADVFSKAALRLCRNRSG